MKCLTRHGVPTRLFQPKPIVMKEKSSSLPALVLNPQFMLSRTLSLCTCLLMLILSSIAISCSSSSDSDDGNNNNNNNNTGPSEQTGEVSGMVSDQDGNVYDNVRITLLEGTTAFRIVSTENTGMYTFSNVPVGSYSVEIELPLSSNAVGADSHAVSVQNNSSVTADFVVDIPPIDGTLVLGAGDVLGEVRNAAGNVPTSASELIYAVNVSTDQALVPILDANGDHVSLGEWDNAEGVVEIYCDGETTYADFNFSGLLPNGVYTIWVGTLNGNQPTGTGAMGSSSGTDNVLDVDGSGNASISIVMDAGSLSVFGSISSCVLTSQNTVVLILDYHIDGNTYGSSPGPDFTEVGHIIFYL